MMDVNLKRALAHTKFENNSSSDFNSQKIFQQNVVKSKTNSVGCFRPPRVALEKKSEITSSTSKSF